VVQLVFCEAAAAAVANLRNQLLACGGLVVIHILKERGHAIYVHGLVYMDGIEG
jgi:hypothetical protein